MVFRFLNFFTCLCYIPRRVNIWIALDIEVFFLFWFRRNSMYTVQL
jgi:hypothetical protein